jgi:hypothetical protein
MMSLAELAANERLLYLEEAAARLGLSRLVVEKDYWVTWLLGRLFEHPQLREELVFKGGTSLSKVYGAIRRFSEDIDLSVAPEALGFLDFDLEQAGSRTARRKEVVALQQACVEHVRETIQPHLEATLRRALGRQALRGAWLRFEVDPASGSPVLWFDYPTKAAVAPGSNSAPAYIEPAVKLELGSLTDQRPRGWRTIRSLAEEALPQLQEPQGEVLALELERTFWEKATILHMEHYRPPERPFAARLARHYSDMADLSVHPSHGSAFSSLDLLERVALHKSLFFPAGWARYGEARPGLLRLLPAEHRRPALERDYRAMDPMFFGPARPFEEILALLAAAERRINSGG